MPARVGEHHHGARLTDAQVAEIRQLRAEQRLGERRIAALLGIARGTVSKIIYGTRRNKRTDDAERPVPCVVALRCPHCGHTL